METSVNTKTEAILDGLHHTLIRSHEVVSGARIMDRQVALWAKSKTKLQHYSLHKSLVIEEANLFDQIIIVPEPGRPDAERLQHHFSWLKEGSGTLVNPNARHMQTRFILILLLEADDLPQGFETIVSRFHKTKAIKLGFHGWTEMLLMAHHVATGVTYTHRSGEDLKNLLDRLHSAKSISTS